MKYVFNPLSGMVEAVVDGVSGYSGYTGYSGVSVSGYSGLSGYSATATSGYSGVSGATVSGYSGYIGVSGYSGVQAPAQIFPKRATLWGNEATVISGTGMSLATNTNQSYATYSNVSSYPLNNSAGWNFLLDSGTYSIDILTGKFPQAGITDIYIDDSTLISSGNDMYTSGSTWNQHITINSVSIGTAGIHKLKWVVSSKNGSSSGYLFICTQVSIKQASD